MQLKDRTRRVPRSQWAVPIPRRQKGGRHGNDTFDGMAYADAEKLLLELGFGKVFERDGLRYTDLQFMSAGSTRNGELHALWWHEGGVFVQMGTYGMTDGRKGPPRRRLSSMDITFQLDVGAFRGNNRKTYDAVRGSGGSTPALHGATVQYRSVRAGATGDRGLLDILESVQGHAHLLPLEQWVDRSHHLYIARDLWFCPDPAEGDFGTKADDLAKKYAPQARTVMLEACSSMPHELGREVMISSGLMEESELQPVLAGMNKQTWHRAEQTINYIRRTLEAGGICWAGARQRKQLADWTRRIADHGAVDDPADPALLVDGPAGMNFASALVACVGREGNPERFLALLDQVDQAVLRRWCTQADAGGLTLVGNILAASADSDLSSTMGLSGNAPEVGLLMEALDVIVDRLGAPGLELGTGQLPLPSLIRACIPAPRGNLDYTLGDRMSIERMGKLVEHALHLGMNLGPLPDRAQEDALFLGKEHGTWAGMGGVLSALESRSLDAQASIARGAISRPRL